MAAADIHQRLEEIEQAIAYVVNHNGLRVSHLVEDLLTEKDELEWVLGLVFESSSQSDLAFTTEPIQFGRVAPVPAAPAPTPVVATQAVVPAASRGPQSRDWCFTCNNFTDDQLHAFSTAVDDGKAAYVCFGVEVGE